jgi:hypothetical protein
MASLQENPPPSPAHCAAHSVGSRMCVFAGRGMVSQLSSGGGTMLAGICSVLCSGTVSCGTQQELSLWVKTFAR